MDAHSARPHPSRPLRDNSTQAHCVEPNAPLEVAVSGGALRVLENGPWCRIVVSNWRGWRRSATQLDPEHWHSVIGDETIADGIAYRLVHNAHRITLKGESTRKARGMNGTKTPRDQEAA